MGIILGILGVIIAIWILGALFQLILGIAGTILGMGLLIGSVALTFMFPYIMIPLLLFSYLANIYQEQGSWDGMWDGLRQKYETHPRVKELFWIGGALFLLVAPTITLPALGIFIFFYLYQTSGGFSGMWFRLKTGQILPKIIKFCAMIIVIWLIITFSTLILSSIQQMFSIVSTSAPTLPDQDTLRNTLKI